MYYHIVTIILKLINNIISASQVKIEDVSDSTSVYAAFGCVEERPALDSSLHMLCRDPRLRELGWRIVTPVNAPLGMA